MVLKAFHELHTRPKLIADGVSRDEDVEKHLADSELYTALKALDC